MVSGSKAFFKHPFEDAIRFWIKFAHQVPTSCEPQTLHFYAVLLFWMRVLLFLDSAEKRHEHFSSWRCYLQMGFSS